MERAVAVFATINFLVIGLSHIFQHRAWAAFFVRVQEMGRPGAFVSGFLSLATGSLIVSFHNVWHGLSAVLTATAWAMVAKGAIVFVFPEIGLRSMARVRLDNSRLFVLPGVAFVIVALIVAFTLIDGAQ